MQFYKYIIFIVVLLMSACHKSHKTQIPNFVLAFGSCNNQNIDNPMWQEISKNKPDVWVWGGDIIYADTEQQDMSIISENYQKQKNNPAYKKFSSTTQIIGSWDDHDYGLNDGGMEFAKKVQSQTLFLDFMGVAKDDPRRAQAGIYNAHDYRVGSHQIKVIILDTRYFRSSITSDSSTDPSKRYKANNYGEGDMLGEAQWQWLENQLVHSEAEFNVILSSIQFLSPTHGFEKWANMPHEVDRMERLIISSAAKNVIILSGDRHISEFSKKSIASLSYPLIDFTSSGLNRALNRDKKEANIYRVGHNVVVNSFGILRFDLQKQQVSMEIRGEHNKLLNSYVQKY
jgi:alkaline phosphatase D